MPRASMRKSAMPLRAVFTPPAPSAGSSTKTARLLPRLGLDDRPRRGAADLLVRRQQHDNAVPALTSGLGQHADRQHGDRDAGFHVVGSGPVEPAVFASERHRARSGRAARRCRSARARGPASRRARTRRADDRRQTVCGSGVTRPPRPESSRASSPPQRSSAALSVDGDSRCTRFLTTLTAHSR